MPAIEGPGWVYTCVGRSHPRPQQWEVAAERSALETRDGIAADWGVYDDLLACMVPGEPFVEHPVVEYRYKMAHPATYFGKMIPRWGHVAQSARRYSTTSFLASTMGLLCRQGLACQMSGPATGFFAYNGTLAYWALPPAPEDKHHITWAAFAASVGVDPLVWSLQQPQ